uniref:Malonyl-CoA:ACP transacylase (MAT) domain-containing protein n=1 Tax=Panagrolaimus sp. JU765 TaxID=591449 RepID=A0AC34QPX4_9BILA
MNSWLKLMPSTSLACQTRFIRKRTAAGLPLIQKSPTGPDILKDSTTFSDVHSALLDPHSGSPYPPEQLEAFLEKAQKMSKKQKFQSRKMTQLNFDHIPIEEQVVALFPGQGAQYLKMGEKVIDCPKSKEIFDKASEVLGYDLLKLCMDGPKTKLDQTIYCQPAVFVASLAAYEKLKMEREDLEDKLTDVAGFSVGEYAALVAAGVLSFQDALKVVKIRAEAMHECNQRVASGMVTVKVNASSRLDDAMAEAREVSDEANELPLCEVANYLFCGVKVVGGSNKALAHLEANAQRFNFQVLKRLAVSGAFHTRLMQPAENILREALKAVEFQPAKCNVYSNFTGKVHGRKGADIRRGLVLQVSSPVKWEQIQQLLFRKHQDEKFPNYIEIGPGRQLGTMFANVSKKAFKSYSNYSC